MPTPTPDGTSPQDEAPRGADIPPKAEDPFGRLIFSYTRAQALSDGVLVDVSETAKEAGFRMPVAITRAAWSSYVEVPEGVKAQDEAGRLWDVLWMCHVAIGRSEGDGSELLFRLHVRNSNRRGTPPLVTLKAVCGPSDDASPCITIMLPGED